MHPGSSNNGLRNSANDRLAEMKPRDIWPLNQMERKIEIKGELLYLIKFRVYNDHGDSDGTKYNEMEAGVS